MKLVLLITVLLLAACGKRQAVTAPPAPMPQKTAIASRPATRKPVHTMSTSKPEPPPAIGVLSPVVPVEDRQQLTKEIDELIGRARGNLEKLQARSTTTERGFELSRIEVFIRQAREAQAGNDLNTARNLAARAALLSEDLLRN